MKFILLNVWSPCPVLEMMPKCLTSFALENSHRNSRNKDWFAIKDLSRPFEIVFFTARCCYFDAVKDSLEFGRVCRSERSPQTGHPSHPFPLFQSISRPWISTRELPSPTHTHSPAANAERGGEIPLLIMGEMPQISILSYPSAKLISFRRQPACHSSVEKAELARIPSSSHMQNKNIEQFTCFFANVIDLIWRVRV